MSRCFEISIIEGDIRACEIVLASGRMLEGDVARILQEKSLLEEKLKALLQLELIDRNLAVLRDRSDDGWDL